jgi:ketosteroid isomerase-like protein
VTPGMSTEDRHKAARDVIRKLGVGRHWLPLVDEDMPPHLRHLTVEVLDAYDRVDLDWLLGICHPELEIHQPPEFPDPHSYRGPEALVDSLLDWPRQWAEFRMDPVRTYAANDEHIVLVAIHRGRAHSVDLQVEAEIVFLMRIVDGRFRSWWMFLSEEDALGRAAERRGHADDDRPAEGDGRERAQEAGPEEARADHR